MKRISIIVSTVMICLVAISSSWAAAPAPVVVVAPAALAFGSQPLGTSSPALSVTVSNAGSAALLISSLSLVGSNAADFLVASNTCTGSPIPPGAVCTIGLGFSPTVTGARSATLNLANNSAVDPVQVPVSGNGTAPAPVVAVAPAALAFGSQPLGTSSPALSVTVSNAGSATLLISSLSLVGSNAGDFLVTSNTCTGSPIPPGAVCTIGLGFSPTATGARSATLNLANNSAVDPVQVPVSGNGTAPAPVVVVAPAALAFGSQPLGTSSPALSVTVSNAGSATLLISSLSLVGSNAGDFLVASNTCTGSPIAPGAVCTIGLGFSPTATGARSATLNLANNSAVDPVQVPVSGNGTAPAPVVAVAPAALAFGSQPLGTSSPALSVTVSNAGSATLLISSLSLVGSNAADFLVASNTCTGSPIPPGAVCTIGLGFSPTATGARSATLNLANNSAVSPVQVPVSGDGTVVDASYFRVVNISQQGNDISLTWTMVGGRSNVVQAAAGGGGSYSTNFTDLSPVIFIPGASLGPTNYLDVGAATNSPARYYRVRLAP